MFTLTEAKRGVHLPFVIFLVAVALYLGVKAAPEESWSGWTPYSAQTMLSSEHWAKDGFVNSKLLFIPIGYSRAVRYLDEPQMRHHARGIVSGGLIGNRLYYTHYPSGYLIPYALLMKSGVEGRVWFRLLSLGFSVAALVLFYVFINMVAGPGAAFFAAAYYGASTMFLDYADSLANQPIDDLLRFAVLVASAGAAPWPGKGAAGAHPRQQRWGRGRVLFIWAAYFVLCLSSYDSVFFLFAWLVGLDMVTGGLRGPDGRFSPPWKRWLVFASAPVAAFAVQMLQNTWYLGAGDMLLDLKGTFMARTDTWLEDGPFAGRLAGRLYSILVPFLYMTGLHFVISIPALALAAAGFLRLRRLAPEGLPTAGIMAVLLASGLIYTAVLSYTGSFPYQGRQLAPALSLLVGSATVLAWRLLAGGPEGVGGGGVVGGNASGSLRATAALTLVPVLVLLWSMQLYRTSDYAARWPNHAMKKETIVYLDALGSLSPNDAVIFNHLKDYTGEDDGDYPQPNPMEEYYTGRTVLNFRKIEDLKRDLKWLRERTDEPFDSIIVSTEKDSLRDVARSLRLAGDLYALPGRYVLVVKGG